MHCGVVSSIPGFYLLARCPEHPSRPVVTTKTVSKHRHVAPEGKNRLWSRTIDEDYKTQARFLVLDSADIKSLYQTALKLPELFLQVPVLSHRGVVTNPSWAGTVHGLHLGQRQTLHL